MKLRNKAFIIIGISWGAFLITTSLLFYPSSILIGATVIFAVLCALLSYKYLIKGIENLIQHLKSFTIYYPFNQRLSGAEKDETLIIQNEINNILQQIQNSVEASEHQVEDKIRSIQKQNIQLQQEITDRISIERKISANKDAITRLAHYDNLTSLPNRIFFNEILNKAMNHAKRHNKLLAILFVDLDNFKSVNANLGITAGDYVLKEMATRFTNTLRSDDILARLDGDEFIVLLNDITKAKFASAVAEKLLKIACQPLRIDNNELSLTASIGISVFPSDADSLEEFLRSADEALRQTKLAGGNNYQFFSKVNDVEAHEFIELESALRKAVDNNEFELYYQPKLNLRKGRVIGVEALIRWTHPTMGPISPQTFITLAEETRTILKIGEWSLREACRINKKWQDEGYEHLTMAVNISPQQFFDPDLISTVAKILKDTGLNPRYLELEINETTLMNDVEIAAKNLNELKSLGVILSIDHFGVGYTSISLLKQFPISILKIDKSFIKGVPQNPNDNAITNAFISLGHNLGLEVIAEGVETAEQVQYLAIQNCDMVQGYFLSHPLPGHKITSQFAKLRDEVLI